ncbi:MAG: galactokinase family protein [bacterium]
MSDKKTIVVSSPGRICLFGEHQDYLGLPVIAAAVNMRAEFSATANGTGVFKIMLPDIGKEEEIDLSREQEYRSKRDYLRSAVNILRRDGFKFGEGYDIALTSGIPIGKGCSSSSAILVAWIGLLSRIATEGRPLTPGEAAKYGYFAEVKEFNEPGGMMDHYTSALGGMVYIETKGEIKLSPLAAKLPGVFVLGDSMEPKDTTGVLGSVKGNAVGGMAFAQQTIPGAAWETLGCEGAAAVAGAPEALRRALTGNLRNRDITREAKAILDSGAPDPEQIGVLLTQEHAELSENLGISTQRIDAMVSGALAAGAWGAKINGSGGGGCMFAYTEETKAEFVRQAIVSAGGEAALLHIDSGLKEEQR